MNKKLRVGIIFGGKSAEHEISLLSAKNIVSALDKEKYEPVLIGIDKAGNWLLTDSLEFLLNSQNPKLIKINEENKQNIVLVPQSAGKITNLDFKKPETLIDVAFPILHGPFGEDGSIQGLLKIADIPFVGPSVLGAAVGMDKDIMKRLLRDAGIPIGKFIAVTKKEIPSFQEISEKIKIPFFVKPANMGSSVGISKVSQEVEFGPAIKKAFLYDRKIVIEENIIGREIECSVLGNETPLASIPGEVITGHEFYSYEAKYIDENGATLEIPAKLLPEEINKIQDLAIKTFQALACEGLGRVDFFLKESGDILVNEINTIPGFTTISMYPKLWEASGMGYSELIDRLIQLAIERFEKEKSLETTAG